MKNRIFFLNTFICLSVLSGCTLLDVETTRTETVTEQKTEAPESNLEARIKNIEDRLDKIEKLIEER